MEPASIFFSNCIPKCNALIQFTDYLAALTLHGHSFPRKTTVHDLHKTDVEDIKEHEGGLKKGNLSIVTYQGEKKLQTIVKHFYSTTWNLLE